MDTYLVTRDIKITELIHSCWLLFEVFDTNNVVFFIDLVDRISACFRNSDNCGKLSCINHRFLLIYL
jgi:hypothetical protein